MEDSSIMKEEYYDQAVACVKDHVLPAQRELYRSCGGDFDKVYGEAMNGNGYFGKVIVPGHVYELGYEKCTCPKVLSGQITVIAAGRAFYISSAIRSRTVNLNGM